MARFLNTRGNARISIAICSRCSMKRPWVMLIPDGNNPGLMVCRDRGCWDALDPYRLPRRPVEDASLPWSRPDTPMDMPAAGLISENYYFYLVSEDGRTFLAP